MFSTRSCKKT